MPRHQPEAAIQTFEPGLRRRRSLPIQGSARPTAQQQRSGAVAPHLSRTLEETVSFARFASAALLLFVSGSLACASSDPAPVSGARATRSPDVISRQEIEQTTAANAYELVNRLRPQWLRNTGVGSISGGTATRLQLYVYVDNARMGTVETLRTISAGGITSIRFLSAERAAAAYPDLREAIAGAIVISTRQ
jgi:hypothetical protein